MRFLLDEPIEGPDQDEFDRLPFAKSVAEQIAATPADASVRFGIFGEWGEGKTSAMRLVATQLDRRHKHVIAWYAPWDTSTIDEAWDALILSLARAVKSDLTAYHATRVFSWLAGSAPEVADASDYTKPIKVMTKPLGRWGKKARAKGREWAMAEIRAALGNRRITVFVDDLDRVTESEVVPRLLMRLRETLDLKGFSFVLGLSPSRIRGALRNAGYSQGSARRFLEKIVEYPIYLSPVTVAARRRLILQAEAIAPNVFRSASLDSVADLLPRNPRRLKLFLRYLLGMGSTLGRFAADEIAWPQLYTTLMLRLEFPTETKALVEDRKAVQELSSRPYNRVVMDVADPAGEAKEARREMRYAPKGRRSRRFGRLCAALSTKMWDSGRYDLAALFALHTDPPFFTFLELFEFFTKAATLGRSEVREMVLNAVKVEDDPEGSGLRNRASALFTGILDMRDRQLDAAVDASRPDDAAPHYEGARISTGLIQVMTADCNWFEDSVLSVQAWTRLRKHCAKWSRFTADPQMTWFRSAEIELLRDATGRLPQDATLDAFGALTVDQTQDHGQLRSERSAAFVSLYDEMYSSMARAASERFVAAFKEVDGISAYTSQEWYWRGRNLLFDPDSVVHEYETRDALKQLAGEASSNSTISTNFLHYFSLLCAGAFETGNNLPRDGCTDLLQDEELVATLWEGLTARSLSLRMIGSLLEERGKVRQLGTPGAVMPIPRSWQAYADAFPNAGPILSELSQSDEPEAGTSNSTYP